jgi:RNA polymerase sigma-32 factor
VPRKAIRRKKERKSRVASALEVEAEVQDDLGSTPENDLDAGSDAPEPIVAEEAAEKEGSHEVEEPTEAAGALAPFDPLARYLAEIRRFPLLDREEEAAVAKRYYATHDPADAFRLVTANLRLVVKIAREFARASGNLLDLIQEGNIGLMEAVKNFDPYRGIRFPSYAVWWVRAYIMRFLMNNWRMVKLGTTQAQRKLFFNLKKETEQLEAMGIEAGPRLLAERLGVKEREVEEMQERMGQHELSLDQPLGGEGEISLANILPDEQNNPEQTFAESEWRDFAKTQVDDFAATLDDKEREIFERRLASDQPMTLQEVGDRFGISGERVRQIESRLKERLKEFVKSRAADIERMHG